MTTIGYMMRENNLKWDIPPSPWTVLEMKKWMELGYDLESFGWFKDKDLEPQRMKKVDFFICHHAQSAKFVYRTGKPFMVICHADDIWRDNAKELSHYASSKNCKGIGYVSSYHKKKLIEWGIDKDKLIDTPVVIDFDQFKRTKPLGDYVSTGGRFSWEKGYEYAAKAVPDIKIYGKWQYSFEDYVKRVKEFAHSQAEFLGYLEPDKLTELLNNSWLYMYTGVDGYNDNDIPINAADGIPTTIKEALAMELQVIATPVKGTIDYKDHVKMIENPKDVQSIKDAINELPKKRNVAGRDFVRKTYNTKRFTNNIEPTILDSV